jgi:hypothetical protein
MKKNIATVLFLLAVNYGNSLNKISSAEITGKYQAWHSHESAFKMWTGNCHDNESNANAELKEHLSKCNINGDSGVISGQCPY